MVAPPDPENLFAMVHKLAVGVPLWWLQRQRQQQQQQQQHERQRQQQELQYNNKNNNNNKSKQQRVCSRNTAIL
jgi:uncharacterized protein HemX